MKMRKIFAIILTIVMAASMLCTGAFATGDSAGVPTFRGAEIEAEAGETITYDVYIENNPGIVGYKVQVDFSEAAFDLETQAEDDFENVLEIALGDFSKDASSKGNVVSNTTAYGCVALWFNVVEVDTDGVAFSVTLKVADDAINGTHAVKIRYDAINTIDNDYNLVAFETIDGSVTVSGGVDGTINNDEVGPSEEELEQMEDGTLSLGGNEVDPDAPLIEREDTLDADNGDAANNDDVDAPDTDDNAGDAGEGDGMDTMTLILIIAACVVAIIVVVLIIVKAKSKKGEDVIGIIPGDDDREMEIEEVMGWDSADADADEDEDDED